MKSQKFFSGLVLLSGLSVFAPQLSAAPAAYEAETSEGRFKIGLFYDNLYKTTLSFTLEQQNLFGTDDNLVLDVSYSVYSSGLSVSSTDPDLFASPWSRTFSFSTRQVSANEFVLRDYSFGTADAEVSFARDIGTRNSVSFAIGYNLLDFKQSEDVPQLVADAEVLNDDQVHTGYVVFRNEFSTLTENEDFATSGSTIGTSFEIGNAGATPYAVVQMSAQHFIPLGDRMFAKGRVAASAGFTNKADFPFNKNTFVGGPGTVRGYKPNSLGPVSSMEFSGEDAVVGGQYALTSSLEMGMIVGDSRNLAVFAFTDAGDAANDTNDLQPSKLKRTHGVGLRWQSPLGPLDVSYAEPVHRKDSNRTQELQFTLGWVF